jgi:NADH-ubiquinone oxidoreductase chain 5
MVGVGSQFFGNAIYVNLNNLNVFDAEFISTFYKTLPVNLSIFGFFLALLLYIFKANFLFKIKTSFIGKKIYNFLNRKWFFDKIYNEFLSQFFFKFGFSISYKFVDRGIFEMIGPTGFSTIALKIGSSIHKLQTGHLYHYNLLLLIGITVLFGIRQLWVFLGCYSYIDYRLVAIFFILLVFLTNINDNDTKKEI